MKRNIKFVTIDFEMAEQMGITDSTAMIIYFVIFGFSQDGVSAYDGGQKELAKVARCTDKTVRNWLSKFEEEGLIIHEKKDPKNTESCDRYKINIVPENFSATHRKPLPPSTGNDYRHTFNISNNINSSSYKACAHVREEEEKTAQILTAKNWIMDNEQTIETLCKNNGLIKGWSPASNMKKKIEPYVDAFIDTMILDGIDPIKRGRVEVKKHFRLWLPKYIQLEQQKKEEDERKQSTSGTSNRNTSFRSVQEDSFDFSTLSSNGAGKDK